MSIASKEARETDYWLRLFQKSRLVDYDFTNLIMQNHELIKLLTSIVKTTQANLNKENTEL